MIIRWSSVRSGPAEVSPLRDLHSAAINAQVVLHSLPNRGMAAVWKLSADSHTAGYAVVGGRGDEPADALTEFYLEPRWRHASESAFEHITAQLGVRRIIAQSNDIFLFPLLQRHGRVIEAGPLLFGKATPVSLPAPGEFRRVLPTDEVFEHKHEPIGTHAIVVEGRIIATAGVLHHYNHPFVDLYMEVEPSHRRRGVGSYLVQSLIRVCRESALEPAARCDARNAASAACLKRAGFTQVGQLHHATL